MRAAQLGRGLWLQGRYTATAQVVS
jgi:hypothetical protein